MIGLRAAREEKGCRKRSDREGQKRYVEEDPLEKIPQRRSAGEDPSEKVQQRRFDGEGSIEKI